MTEDARYRTPQALNRAITDRLRTLSAETGQPLQDLRRQFAYDRFLSRVFTAQPERWVLKGGTAMLARLGAYARHSDDIDLLSQTQGVSESEALLEAELALRQAVTTDLNDQFRFTLDPGRRVADGGIALRVTVTAFLGVTEFARFHVDLVVGLHMTGSPDTLGALGTVANLPAGKWTTTIESKTNFIGSAKLGQRIVGEATPVHRGKRTQVWQTRITSKENGRLVAVVTQTQMVLE